MTLYNKYRCSLLLMSLVIVAFSYSAFAGMHFPTAIHIQKPIYFQKPDGEAVPLNPGVYEVSEKSETTILVGAIDIDQSQPIALQAVPAEHEESLSMASADLIPSPDNDPDKRHILFLRPDGLTLEAVGSYSGIFTRSASMWSSLVPDKETGTFEEPLTLELEEAIYFKTVGGDPQAVQPGLYEVTKDARGLFLTHTGDSNRRPIHIETEAMGTSAAVMMPEFNDNQDLELLMLATANGQSLMAIGSHSGTFPRGLFKKFKRGIKKVGGRIKKSSRRVGGRVKRGAQLAYGNVGRPVVKNVKRGARFSKKAFDMKRKLDRRLKKEAWKYCTNSLKRAKNCVDVIRMIKGG